jgi:hypothetical protein
MRNGFGFDWPAKHDLRQTATNKYVYWNTSSCDNGENTVFVGKFWVSDVIRNVPINTALDYHTLLYYISY